jgi:hypothetical protein
MAGTVERFEAEETGSEWLIEGSATWVESDLNKSRSRGSPLVGDLSQGSPAPAHQALL